MSNINNLPNSLRWAIMQALLAALRADSKLAGITVLHNPRTPQALNQGNYQIFLRDQVNNLVKKPGQIERRSHQFLLGAVARTDAADSEADALHEAAADVLRTHIKNVVQGTVLNISEMSTQFEAANLEVDGSLCESTWELEYVKPRPQ